MQQPLPLAESAIRSNSDPGELLSTPALGKGGPVLWARAKNYVKRYARGARNRARAALAKAWVHRRVHRLKTKDAIQLIESRRLHTVSGSWHFSWDIERFYKEMFLYEDDEHSYVFHIEPIAHWAPAPLFTDDPSLNTLIARVGKNCPFWLLKLTSFDDFLDRRSAIASQPKKHFPTRQTYPRVARKLACELERIPLHGNHELFCEYYKQWKQFKYDHTGEDILNQINAHRNVPENWLFLHVLRAKTGGDYKGISLVVEDGRSCFVFNLASEPGHGRLMLVESIKECCNIGYSTYDCGVTAIYGNYKSGIYLDRMETEDSGIPSFLSRSTTSM